MIRTVVAHDAVVALAEGDDSRGITGNRGTGVGNAPAVIKADGVHPTIDGHRYLATKLADDIRRLGLAHPPAGTDRDDEKAGPGIGDPPL